MQNSLKKSHRIPQSRHFTSFTKGQLVCMNHISYVRLYDPLNGRKQEDLKAHFDRLYRCKFPDTFKNSQLQNNKLFFLCCE
jgi:hypothetical protein